MDEVLIKMKMPTSCYVCPFCDYASARCDAVKGNPYTPESRYEKRADFCPLISVPKHGRLIDADVLCKVLQKNSEDEWNNKTAPFSWAYAYDCVKDTVENMPTIIPAEENET